MPTTSLDFSIYSDLDRTNEVKKILTQNPHPTAAQLDLYANYILYGKDASTGRSAVDDGEIKIKTKYGSYTRKNKEVSLDSLLETPTFDERDIKPIKRSIYKNPKPKLDENLEELVPLREEIKKAEERLEAAKATNADRTTIYHLNHWLISLRTQQYTVQEAAKPPLALRSAPHRHYETPDIEFVVYPLGVRQGITPRFDYVNNDATQWIDTYPWRESLTDYYVDFTNPVHVRCLIENWEALTSEDRRSQFSDIPYLLSTLDWYANKANLAPSRRVIYEGKKFKVPNATLRAQVNDEFGTNYNVNYISTIYSQSICKKIADAAALHYREWRHRGDPSAWQQCPACGEWRLKDASLWNKQGKKYICKSCKEKKRWESHGGRI